MMSVVGSVAISVTIAVTIAMAVSITMSLSLRLPLVVGVVAVAPVNDLEAALEPVGIVGFSASLHHRQGRQGRQNESLQKQLNIKLLKSYP